MSPLASIGWVNNSDADKIYVSDRRIGRCAVAICPAPFSLKQFSFGMKSENSGIQNGR